MALLLAAGLLLGALQADDLDALAAQANVDVTDLRGAVNSTGLEPRAYLHMTGELAPPAPPINAALERRVDCVIWQESRNTPRAVNPRSGASGLGQFLPSTWRTTPQGRAGYSVFDPVANRAAVRYMLEAGRAREFEVITRGLC